MVEQIKLAVFSLVAMGIVFVVMFTTVTMHKQAHFCMNCHKGIIFNNSCKKLPSEDIACIDCHSHETAGAITEDTMNTLNTISILEVEIKNSLCTQDSCHPLNTLSTAKVQYKKIVPFQHKTHTIRFDDNLELRCTSCHANLGGEKHFQTDERTCNICHFIDVPQALSTQDERPISDCTVCHKDIDITREIYGKTFKHLTYEKEKKVICSDCHFKIIQGQGKVDKANCNQCHTEEVDHAEDASIMHYKHLVKKKTPCTPCHTSITHGWVKGNDDYDGNQYLSPADSEYEVQNLIMMGRGGKGVKGLPDPMYLATLNCSACHKNEFFAKVNSQVCIDCHENNFDKILIEQKLFVSSRMKVLKSFLLNAENYQTPETFHIIQEAAHNYDLIKKDGSLGAHNIKYVKDLLDHSVGQLKDIQNQLVGVIPLD